MFDVNFDLSSPQLICHPGYKDLEDEILTQLNPFFLRDHFLLFSSGTSKGNLKGYALSKKALFENAMAVNQHFSLTSKDIWGLSLPIYHVGGLSVLARAHLLGNKVVDGRKWGPLDWIEKMKEVTITTLVPTQLYDLVKLKLSPWKDLRFLVVGGDFLGDELKEKACALGWPVIRTFGMSEVCSQLASSKTPDSDDLHLLSPHEVKVHEGRLLVKSKSLFTLEFILGEKFQIKTAKELCDKDGFYPTQDKVKVAGNLITPLGRMGLELKRSGHLVNLSDLKNSLERLLLASDLYQKMELVVEKDSRMGNKLVLLTLEEGVKLSLNEINRHLYPVKIDEVRLVDSFSRTKLGKLKLES